MKAAVLTQLNFPLEVAEVQNQELKVGQIRVRMITSGICGSQVQEIKGNKGNGKFLPHLMGHEGFGIVEEVGSGVSKVRKDDRVVLHWRKGSGIESDFPTYIFDNRVISSGKVTTLAEVVTVSENRVTKVPASTNPEFAALLGCSLTTAFSLVEKESELGFGETVLVIGCGGVGLSVIAAAKVRGAGLIVAVDRVKSKDAISKKVGADQFFDSLTNLPDDFDLIIDTSGNAEIVSSAILLLGDNGRFIMVGQPEPKTAIVIRDGLQMFNGNGRSISATQGGGTFPDTDIPRYLRLYEHGRLAIDDLITHRFQIEHINEAFDTLQNGNAGRILISF
jgi:Zn-dependent alcohol dehydrogenase